MEKIIKSAVEEYQCSGCISGCDTICFKENNIGGGVGCGRHISGTLVMGVGKIFLGMPNGFNRLGIQTELKPIIYKTFDISECAYNKWNIPTWKYVNKENHTIVRGMMPRRNENFIHIYLENCIDKINCLEIKEEDILGMD